MTPAARHAAAIEVLDAILAGAPAEKSLTNWARANRYAGSKDRAAIRDLVFDVLRCRRSYGARGGAETGRALILGALRSKDVDPETVFSGVGYAPPVLSEFEVAAGRLPNEGAEALDCPDWLWPVLEQDLGAEAAPYCTTQQGPAPVGMRVNLGRSDRATLAERLARDGIETRPSDVSASALIAEGRPRGLTSHPAYLDGSFELQDAGSQWLSDQVPLQAGETLLDFCAGGGGKTLAVAARVAGRFVAHDVSAARMSDLPRRAERAGTRVRVEARTAALHQADTVLIDVPCSGSGTWRRAPDAKWKFTKAKLETLLAVQGEILDQTAALTRPGGTLVYATCSVLEAENAGQVEDFLARNSGFVLAEQSRLYPNQDHDGYYVAILKKDAA